MKGMLTILLSIALAAVSWGTYGPVLKLGKDHLTAPVEAGSPAKPGNPLIPFMCVGVAYFLIAVVIPVAWLMLRGEKGSWSARGLIWSLVAGTAGALGALGVIMALKSGGNPIFVMPLIFGGAPVVNTLFTMLTARTIKEASAKFYAGLILVVVGAALVLIFRPHHSTGPEVGFWQQVTENVVAYTWVAVTILSWGVYGPILHWGQAAMSGSRLRPLLCVGLAYFAVAVIVPAALLWGQEGLEYRALGLSWSLAGGAAGAFGAIGIILAFNFGGKPVYVMPLVFGVAPVVNTFVTLLVEKKLGESLHSAFIAGLAITAAGAAAVLVFAPKAHGKPAAPPPKPAEEAATAKSA